MSGVSAVVRKLVWVCLFGVAFALVESSVVVYLRALYYAEGFSFPLKLISLEHLTVELSREVATIVMLVAVGVLAGSSAWEKFAYFLIAFGIWDIFYYVWLKVMVNWPVSITDWDILFLIPLPWIGPVVTPVLISLLMIVCGTIMVLRIQKQTPFRPTRAAWVLAILGTAMVLCSFMMDTQATLHGAQPEPFRYDVFVSGLVLYLVSFAFALRTLKPLFSDGQGK